MDSNKNKSKDIICTKEMSRSEFLATMSATFSFVVGGTIFGRFLTDAEAQEIAQKAKGDKTDIKTGEHKPKNSVWIVFSEQQHKMTITLEQIQMIMEFKHHLHILLILHQLSG